MVSPNRQEEPQYVCVVPVEGITKHLDEEVIAFGVSVDEAKAEAKRLLVENYKCEAVTVNQLMEHARIEPLSLWCAPNKSQD